MGVGLVKASPGMILPSRSSGYFLTMFQILAAIQAAGTYPLRTEESSLPSKALQLWQARGCFSAMLASIASTKVAGLELMPRVVAEASAASLVLELCRTGDLAKAHLVPPQHHAELVCDLAFLWRNARSTKNTCCRDGKAPTMSRQ